MDNYADELDEQRARGPWHWDRGQGLGARSFELPRHWLDPVTHCLINAKPTRFYFGAILPGQGSGLASGSGTCSKLWTAPGRGRGRGRGYNWHACPMKPKSVFLIWTHHFSGDFTSQWASSKATWTKLIKPLSFLIVRTLLLSVFYLPVTNNIL